ncbi:GntR family transcriptional regulator [Streptomyces sp. NPDC057910]|uniref:GntR family transcriptional regulator n=1 Tax=Streptomyces sp. NPDC057910 TaxID=3346278 RepID=UPI0036EFA066
MHGGVESQRGTAPTSARKPVGGPPLQYPGERPRYQVIADEVLSQPFHSLPSAGEIARRYRVPLSTAQFVRRSVVTRLRAPSCLMTAAGDGATGRRPVWQQVADDLRAQVTAGRFTGRLPDRVALAAYYGVSEDTVTKAARQLAHERVLQVTPGRRGTHVHPRLLTEDAAA